MRDKYTQITGDETAPLYVALVKRPGGEQIGIYFSYPNGHTPRETRDTEDRAVDKDTRGKACRWELHKLKRKGRA